MWCDAYNGRRVELGMMESFYADDCGVDRSGAVQKTPLGRISGCIVGIEVEMFSHQKTYIIVLIPY